MGEASANGDPPITAAEIAKLLEKRTIKRSNIPRIDIFPFKGDRVTHWLEVLEQIFNQLTPAEKFAQLFEYVWWECTSDVEEVVKKSNNDWAEFKRGMQKTFKLGDGMLTIDHLYNMNRDDFTTIRAFANTFEKTAERVPRLSEEMQCVIFLGKFSGYEAMELTRGGAAGRKTTWDTIKRNIAAGNMDQVFHHQIKVERKKRKAVGTLQGTDSILRGMLSNMTNEIKELRERVTSSKVLTVTQPSGKRRKEGGDGEEEAKEGEPEGMSKLTKNQRKAKNIAIGGQGSGKGQVTQQAIVQYGHEPSTSTAQYGVTLRKEEAMAQRGAEAGPSGPTLRKGGQRREQRISRNLEELPIYRAGDSLRVFLQDLEEYAFRREWGDREKNASVRGAGMYKRRIEGAVAGCTRWRICKVTLWRDMGEFPGDDVEDDLRFDGTNLEDFVESLQMTAERGEWREEEKRKQLITKSDKGEKEEVRGIVEGS
ncbi:hypothetical protein CBR_g26109 [Chara braunii]|uniref:Retrotransposon gag domain-containing protein n=1 Tax=Chara braunii TaxID=69332 RepID=A0A388JVX2_CHABU|nr:hypothetical protein CBR_g26109 [Chara braunii]|eukprot:GBG61946.1 hypothetical protein CBR_g26109 [Chara braunii]